MLSTVVPLLAGTPIASADRVAWATLLAVGAQAAFIGAAFMGDMRRRKKQSTLEAWSATMNSHSEARRELVERFKRDRLSNDDLVWLAEEPNQSTREHLTDYLNAVERLAVGVRLRIYDEDVLYRIGRKVISGGFERYRPFVEAKRLERPNPRLYQDFEHLADRFDSRYKRESADRSMRSAAGKIWPLS